jgi:hypothetical protein
LSSRTIQAPGLVGDIAWGVYHPFRRGLLTGGGGA